MEIPLSTVFIRISAAALINPMQRLFEGGAYSSNYCNWQLKSLLHLGQIVITFRTLLHLGQNVITFRTLLHLGSFITFRPSTEVLERKFRSLRLLFVPKKKKKTFNYMSHVQSKLP